MLLNLNSVIPTLQLRWLSLRKFCYVNIQNTNANKNCNGFSAKISSSEKSKGSNLKENIDFRVRTEEYLELSRTSDGTFL